MREERMDEEPIALEVYEELAEAYAAKIDTKPHNAYYERPATLSLLPDLQGKEVLDAGCGPGKYAEILIERGAKVVCFDVSPKMVALAKRRLGDRAEFHVADLEKPLSFLRDGTFDMVVCPLVLDYVRDYRPVFVEFFRVLRPRGLLVFSVGHPFFNHLYFKSEDYFSTERVECDWGGFGKKVRMPSYRRPLGALLNTLADAGFALEKLLEPLPTEEFREVDPEHYEKLMRFPSFVCIRARKRE